jgi:hypothetical protein
MLLEKCVELTMHEGLRPALFKTESELVCALEHMAWTPAVRAVRKRMICLQLVTVGVTAVWLHLATQNVESVSTGGCTSEVDLDRANCPLEAVLTITVAGLRLALLSYTWHHGLWNLSDFPTAAIWGARSFAKPEFAVHYALNIAAAFGTLGVLLLRLVLLTNSCYCGVMDMTIGRGSLSAAVAYYVTSTDFICTVLGTIFGMWTTVSIRCLGIFVSFVRCVREVSVLIFVVVCPLLLIFGYMIYKTRQDEWEVELDPWDGTRGPLKNLHDSVWGGRWTSHLQQTWDAGEASQ